MNANAFRYSYDYHFTENRKIWESYVSPLSHEQFTQHVDYSHGSVRNQIVHLMSVDDTWFSGLRGVEPPNRLLPLLLRIGRSSVHTGTTLSKICAIIFRNCGMICYSKNRSRMEKTKISSCGKCFFTWLIMVQIIAHNFSDRYTIWKSRQHLKISSSTFMITCRYFF